MIDTSKPMQVRYSDEVCPVIEHIENGVTIAAKYSVAGFEFIRLFTKSGKSTEVGGESKTLENVPPPLVYRYGWFNHYKNFTWGPYDTKEQADFEAGQYRLGCTKVDLSFVEGDGV